MWHQTCLDCTETFNQVEHLDRCPNCRGYRFISQLDDTGRRKFDAVRDALLIEKGSHFFCRGHATAVPVDDMSPDQRYCISCYDFLKNEATLLPPNKRPKWIPKPSKISAEKTIPVPGDGVLILSTSNPDKSTVDKIQPQTADVTHGRGRRKKELPEGLIKKLAGRGMGSKRIAAELQKQGIPANYRTVARVISRPML